MDRLSWSDEVYRIFGVEPGRFEASLKDFLQLVHPADREAVADLYHRSVRCTDRVEMEHRIIRPGTGELRYVKEICRHFRDDTGAVVRSIGMVRDITERKEREKAERALQEELIRARKLDSVGRLAAGVAHDLNNLLSPILGFAEMLLVTENEAAARRYYTEQILSAGGRARELARRLLALGRKQALKYRLVDLNRSVQDMQSLMRNSIGKNISIEFIPGRDIKTIRADTAQLERVILNLALNGQDAMPKGGRLTLQTAMADLGTDGAARLSGAKPGPYVMLEVRDTGCGMDAKTQKHLFEPFFSTKGEDGAGLGLATAYGIVKQHGGEISVESEPGKGSAFRIYFPVCEKGPIEEKIEEEAEAPAPEAETARKHVVLVEQDPAVRKVVSQMLERRGLSVVAVESGAAALEVLSSSEDSVHVLLTEARTGDMRGKDLAAEAVERRPGLKTLFMSGFNLDMLVMDGILQKEDPFIQKPFNGDGLAQKIHEMLAGPEKGVRVAGG